MFFVLPESGQFSPAREKAAVPESELDLDTRRRLLILPSKIARVDDNYNYAAVYRFFPEKATSLVIDILNKLFKMLRIRPCPIVFASFSGGSKACMQKVLQIIGGTSEAHNKNIQFTDQRSMYCIQMEFIIGYFRHHPLDYKAGVVGEHNRACYAKSLDTIARLVHLAFSFGSSLTEVSQHGGIQALLVNYLEGIGHACQILSKER
ncbi:hypothetical protein RJT34_16960 [Clitoria ternatea]|uniref:Uncharacterized protein n=1 Tax=Clitoria ternatea TaxID=43366 RepID=A0AAN9PE87_CLITE